MVSRIIKIPSVANEWKKFRQLMFTHPLPNQSSNSALSSQHQQQKQRQKEASGVHLGRACHVICLCMFAYQEMLQGERDAGAGMKAGGGRGRRRTLLHSRTPVRPHLLSHPVNSKHKRLWSFNDVWMLKYEYVHYDAVTKSEGAKKYTEAAYIIFYY